MNQYCETLTKMFVMVSKSPRQMAVNTSLTVISILRTISCNIQLAKNAITEYYASSKIFYAFIIFFLHLLLYVFFILILCFIYKAQEK